MYGFSEMMMEEAEKQFLQEVREKKTMTSEEKLAIGEAIHAMIWLADLADSEKRNEDLRKGIDDLSKTIFSGAQAARIKELEDALSEYQRLGKTIAGRVPCLVPHGDCGRCSADPREVCGALEQIAEGKIGPDAGVAHKECKECSDERLLASLVEHENQTHAIIGAILGTDDTLENVAKRAMTRIAELEKWLKEERAGAIRTESYDHCEGMYTIDLPDAMIRAQQELQSECKIGQDAKPREGLYGKYRISKADGSPVDPEADYFVLRLDTDPVARRAAREYSYMTVDRKLALDLQERITKYNPKMMDCINLQFFGVEKPRVWQITEERIEALEYMCEWHFCTEKLQCCEKYPEYILQDMLKEAG